MLSLGARKLDAPGCLGAGPNAAGQRSRDPATGGGGKSKKKKARHFAKAKSSSMGGKKKRDNPVHSLSFLNTYSIEKLRIGKKEKDYLFSTARVIRSGAKKGRVWVFFRNQVERTPASFLSASSLSGHSFKPIAEVHTASPPTQLKRR